MKRLFLILLLVGACFALNDVAVPYSFSPGNTITASQFNANNDTLETRINDNADTTDIEFIRFTDFVDSTIANIKADTISGNPIIDSIQGSDVIAGNPVIDSIQGADIITGNPIIDSMTGPTTITGALTGTTTITATGALAGATINTGNGAVECYAMDQDVQTTDNVQFNVANIDSLIRVNAISGNPIIDSIQGTIISGDTLCVVNSDNVHVGIKSNNVGNGRTATLEFVSGSGLDPASSCIIKTGTADGSAADEKLQIKNNNGDTLITFNQNGTIVVPGDIYTTDWTDYSTSTTLTGNPIWTAMTDSTIMYKVVGDIVYVSFSMNGTSGSVIDPSFTLPFNSADGMLAIVRVNNNSTKAAGIATMSASSNIVILGNIDGSHEWNVSGTKNSTGQFWYRK